MTLKYRKLSDNLITNMKQKFEKYEIISLEFHSQISENIKRIGKNLKIKTVSRVGSNLEIFIKLGKDKLEIFNQCNVVYRLKCQCGKSYVGQTKGSLHIRRDEHKKNIKLKEKDHNVVSRHLSLYYDGDSNFINWENTEILHQETNIYKRLFAEMVFI